MKIGLMAFLLFLTVILISCSNSKEPVINVSFSSDRNFTGSLSDNQESGQNDNFGNHANDNTDYIENLSEITDDEDIGIINAEINDLIETEQLLDWQGIIS